MKNERIDLGLPYAEAAHGVQSAIAYEMGKDERHAATEPKHLRVGIDSAHVSDAAIAFLLIQKGIFTMEEYLEAVRLQMNNELAGYEKKYAPITFR